jgi:isopentenyl-diphosphate delta-isomerase
MSESDNPEIDLIMNRKRDGIDIPLSNNVQSRFVSTFLEYVKFIHNALPEIDFDEINTATEFLNHQFGAPIIIDSMTGGTPEALKINSRLGQLAETFVFGMGVGSQRAGLKSTYLAETYSVARKNAPSAFLIANIGGAQLAEGLDIHTIEKLISMIDANALVIHLNPLQELIQPEGEPKYRGVWDKITKIRESISIPIIVKEVGSGISREVALKLEKAHIDCINIAGSGGTSWAGIEKIRATKVKNDAKENLGELFWDWGIPTALSLIEVKNAVDLPLIASGGIRNGLEIAKCIALGATMSAMAYPFLKAASESKESLFTYSTRLIYELKGSMFLTGSSNIRELAKSRLILTGELADMVINNERYHSNKS